MGYCVFQMPAIKDLKGEWRSPVQGVVRQLEDAKTQVLPGYIPYFEPLGRSYFKKRIQKLRLVAKLETAFVEGRQVPVVILFDLLYREDPAYGDGSVEHL